MLEFIYTFYHNSIVFSIIERYSDNSQEIIISQSERVFLVFIPPMPKTFSFRAITCPSILFKKLFPNMNVHNIILTNFAQALPINNFQVVRIIYIERIDATDNTNKFVTINYITHHITRWFPKFFLCHTLYFSKDEYIHLLHTEPFLAGSLEYSIHHLNM